MKKQNGSRTRGEVVIPEPMEVRGEESIGGTSAELNSDDNTLDAVHELGMYRNVSEEHPKELNMNAELGKTEKRSK